MLHKSWVLERRFQSFANTGRGMFYSRPAEKFPACQHICVHCQMLDKATVGPGEGERRVKKKHRWFILLQSDEPACRLQCQIVIHTVQIDLDWLYQCVLPENEVLSLRLTKTQSLISSKPLMVSRDIS